MGASPGGRGAWSEPFANGVTFRTPLRRRGSDPLAVLGVEFVKNAQPGVTVLLEAKPRRRFGDAWIVYFSFLKGIKTGGEASGSTSQTWRLRK